RLGADQRPDADDDEEEDGKGEPGLRGPVNGRGLHETLPFRSMPDGNGRAPGRFTAKAKALSSGLPPHPPRPAAAPPLPCSARLSQEMAVKPVGAGAARGEAKATGGGGEAIGQVGDQGAAPGLGDIEGFETGMGG